jgi:cysteine desulfurase/selenocysteine lyase
MNNLIEPHQKTIFDIDQIRNDFPVLHQTINGHPLVYLDNAATSQKPQSVIDSLSHYYQSINANVHRGVHLLSQRATDAYENSRETIKQFIHAKHTHEIIFTRGTTESINLVAQSYGRSFLNKDDEIIISAMEHHSNIVPWQIMCQQTGAKLRVVPINDAGEMILEEYEKLLSDKTKFVAIVHISNSLGTINPIKQIIKLAHAVGAKVLIDGAQAAPHADINVLDLDCDFYALSGHKLFGPTGIGVLYGKESLLNKMPPYQGGGDMIKMVSFEKSLYNDLPYKFEAGTPNIAGAIGLMHAIEYINQVGFEKIRVHEDQLLQYATHKIREIPNIRLIGTAKNKASILAFVFNDLHAHDVATILDHYGIAVRAGHHCTMPLMERFNVPATVRASFSFYNTQQEIDKLVHALYQAREVFKL